MDKQQQTNNPKSLLQNIAGREKVGQGFSVLVALRSKRPCDLNFEALQGQRKRVKNEVINYTITSKAVLGLTS